MKVGKYMTAEPVGIEPEAYFEGLPFRYNGERSFPQCVAMYECARKNGMPASGRHG